MILIKNLYLIPFLNSFVYIEGNLIIIINQISIKKLKLTNNLFILNLNSLFFLYHSIINSLFYLSINFKKIEFFLNEFFFGSFLGFSNGFRLIGRGYKVHTHINNFVFRLGYSHNIYYTLPFFIKAFSKLKFKKFWIIKSLNYLSLSKFIYLIRDFKTPNTYMYKGIYPKNNIVDYNIKSTKIGFL